MRYLFLGCMCCRCRYQAFYVAYAFCVYLNRLSHLQVTDLRGLFRVFQDMGYSPIFILGYGILTLFILGYGIFRNFGIWDIGIHFGIQVKFIL